MKINEMKVNFVQMFLGCEGRVVALCFVSGHDFSRAVTAAKSARPLGSGGCFSGFRAKFRFFSAACKARTNRNSDFSGIAEAMPWQETSVGQETRATVSSLEPDQSLQHQWVEVFDVEGIASGHFFKPASGHTRRTGTNGVAQRAF
jgi:hypothetical protein